MEFIGVPRETFDGDRAFMVLKVFAQKRGGGQKKKKLKTHLNYMFFFKEINPLKLI